MSPRPRTNKYTHVPNLYGERLPSGNISYVYKNVLTGEKKRLGLDKSKAEKVARQANALLAEKIIEKETLLILSGVGASASSMTWGEWCDEYMKIQNKRANDGLIKKSTLKQIHNRVKRVKEKFKNRKILLLTTLDFTRYLKDEFAANGKAGMAVMMRSTLVDICAEAISEGILPSDKGNPAQFTKPITRKTKRARLTLEVFKEALAWAQDNKPPYFWKSMLFALVTAQRRGDISEVRFSDIKVINGAEWVGIIQKKTGTKVAIPLDLHLDTIGYSVRDVIALCRQDRVVSQYMFHHSKAIGSTRVGGKVAPDTFTYNFADCIKALNIDWGEFNPPSFHELRSLSGREFDKQGVDIQKLLGHKQRSTSDIYRDSRGFEWEFVDLASASS